MELQERSKDVKQVLVCRVKNIGTKPSNARKKLKMLRDVRLGSDSRALRALASSSKLAGPSPPLCPPLITRQVAELVSPDAFAAGHVTDMTRGLFWADYDGSF